MNPHLRAIIRDRFDVDLELDGDGEALNTTLTTMLSRRTHRAYSHVQIPEPLLNLLIATALCASSKSDYQQATIIKLRDPGKRGRIAALFPSMPWIGKSPEFLVFCADAHRLERISTMRGHPQNNRDLEAFFNATVDAALVMQTFILAAESVGLVCCPISAIRNQMETVAKELALPDGVFPIAGLCLGFPERGGHISMRLPPSVTVHTNTYDDSKLEQEVDAYDQRRHARHATPREKQREPEKFGYADVYGWSEDKARHQKAREGASFAAWIKSHGFEF
ncbi:MAG TPA: nitroreductase family protein [Xanthobacteraceae bacterium]|jgi:nitroreductase|nr:nitroreductase family protein [Xanthobacteraceae bacterium]